MRTIAIMAVLLVGVGCSRVGRLSKQQIDDEGWDAVYHHFDCAFATYDSFFKDGKSAEQLKAQEVRRMKEQVNCKQYPSLWNKYQLDLKQYWNDRGEPYTVQLENSGEDSQP